MMNARFSKTAMALIGLGLFAWCAGSAGGQPDEPPPQRGETANPAPSTPPHRLGPGMRMAPQQRPWTTPEEREQVEEFAQEHMPNLYRMVQESPERAMRRWRMLNHAAREYRRYQQELSESPERGEAMLQRIRQQDELFALVREYRAAATPQQDQIRERLREKMREIVVQMLEEREQRVARLKQMLLREEQALENDRGRVDEITTQRVETLLDETRPGRRGGMGGGPGGPAGAGITAPDEPRNNPPPSDRPR